jgi:CRISPR-associated endonuclease Csn1
MWGLNGLLKDHNRRGGDDEREVKNRDDHRHHFLDAFVVACTDRRILLKVATASGRAEELELDRWAEKGGFPEPFEGYREQLSGKLEEIVISHKPDHGIAPGRARAGRSTSGQLHEETAYGMVDEEIDGKRFNLVTRKPIDALTEREIGQVRDARLRGALEEVAYEAKRDGEKLPEALARYGEKHGIRRVRLLKTDQSAVAVSHGGGRFVKAYVPGDNHRVDIFEADGGDWSGEAVTVFDANRKGFRPAWLEHEPQPRLIMRVHKGDLVEADFGEGRQIWRVVRLEPSAKRIRLVTHRDAGNYEERHKSDDDPFRWNFATYARLKAANARRVRVDPIGRVKPVEERP